ncbi:MAG: alpha/beta fold hydrolase [Granulosicoccus sp.]
MKTTVNSQEIFVGDGGVAWRGDQRTLVLQHGAGMNRTVWVLLTRYFARHGYNVVAADLPGHGASGGHILASIEAQAEHVWALLDSLHETHDLPVDSVVMAGHSMGALLVTEAAAQRHESVGDLLLFGVGYPMMVAQPLLDAAQANQQSAVDMIAIYSHSFASRLGHNPVAGISVQNTAMAMLEQAAPGVLYADLMACNDYRGLEQACDSLAKSEGVRCAVISGDADQMTPMKSTRTVVELLNAEHIVLRDCGHMMMSEQPEQTLQAACSVLL